LDGEGHPPSGEQWTGIIEKIKRAYCPPKELDRLRAQHAAAKKKARKQREKEAAESATADGSCAQQVAEPHAKKMTKKQRKAKISAGVVADEEEVGLDIDAAVVPPMKESWEPLEFKIFVQYGPPAREACRPELAFVASARGNVDAVDWWSCRLTGRVWPRTAQRRAGWRQERRSCSST
jgi:hypothetical protein